VISPERTPAAFQVTDYLSGERGPVAELTGSVCAICARF